MFDLNNVVLFVH